jgi:hypothetical protein
MKTFLGLSLFIKGGPGSGNFGHVGRPSKVGGSGRGNSSRIPKKPKKPAGTWSNIERNPPDIG